MFYGLACLFLLHSAPIQPPLAVPQMPHPKLSLTIELEPGSIEVGSKPHATLVVSNQGKKSIYVCSSLSSIPLTTGYQKGMIFTAAAYGPGIRTGITPSDSAKEVWKGTLLLSQKQLRFPIQLPSVELSGDIEIYISARISVGQSPEGVPSSWSDIELKSRKKVHVHSKPQP